MSAAAEGERLAVVGLGLLGGSVALASPERGLAREIRGVEPALEQARADVAAAEAALQRAGVILGYARITSPITAQRVTSSLLCT